ncbi:MAG: hypothetical protein GY884_19320 [Proteobacteria bacterium]|nr:hypothetical protein [Pseudomonadota bacterium]
MNPRILIVERGPMAGHLHRSLRASGAETVSVDIGLEVEPAYEDDADFNAIVPPMERPEDLVSAAHDSGCEAIHPGVGAMAEQPDLVRACTAGHVGYIGPLAEQISALADRWTTREIAVAAGIPVIPGSGRIFNLSELEEPVRRLGYPLWVKDAWGLNAQLACNDTELGVLVRERIHSGQSVWIESHIERARHVVVTFVGDEEGAVVPLGVRERALRHKGRLSVDRFPALISADLTAAVEDAAVTLAEAVHFQGVGSVSFLVDDAGGAHCIGLRPRLQVGTLLNEAVHGLRLAEVQLRMAQGDGIGWTVDDLAPSGTALGIRIRTEDRGVLTRFRPPDGVDVHTHLREGSIGSGLLAVMVVKAPTAQASVVRAVAALSEFEIEGVDAGLAEQIAAISDPRFWDGDVISSLW